MFVFLFLVFTFLLFEVRQGLATLFSSVVEVIARGQTVRMVQACLADTMSFAFVTLPPFTPMFFFKHGRD